MPVTHLGISRDAAVHTLSYVVKASQPAGHSRGKIKAESEELLYLRLVLQAAKERFMGATWCPITGRLQRVSQL